MLGLGVVLTTGLEGAPCFRTQPQTYCGASGSSGGGGSRVTGADVVDQETEAEDQPKSASAETPGRECTAGTCGRSNPYPAAHCST